MPGVRLDLLVMYVHAQGLQMSWSAGLKQGTSEVTKRDCFGVTSSPEQSIVANQVCHHHSNNSKLVRMGSNTDTFGCRAGWGEEAALDPEELPAWLPPLQNIPVIYVPHPAAIFYSGNTGPALAFQEVAQSQFVTANFDMEEASLAARMQDLLSAPKSIAEWQSQG